MKPSGPPKAVGFLLTCFLVLCATAAQDQIRVRTDGSIYLPMNLGGTGSEKVILHFGLPRVALSKRSNENGVLRSVWHTNGIQYTQTVLLCRARFASGPSQVLLLVDIEGANTHTEYREAFADLRAEIRGQAAELELRQGFLWVVREDSKLLLGALEVPESGVKESCGQVLSFYGYMPPSLNGSLTLKIPLSKVTGHDAEESLYAVEYQSELRRALKNSASENASGPRLVFDEETNAEQAPARDP